MTTRYIDLLVETRVADEEEAKRLAELNQVAEITHERARIAVVALNAFDDVPLGTCGYCAAARGELVGLEHRERAQACAANRNLRVYLREIQHDREQRHENLAREHELLQGLQSSECTITDARRRAERILTGRDLLDDWRSAGYRSALDAARAMVGSSGDNDMDEAAAVIVAETLEAE